MATTQPSGLRHCDDDLGPQPIGDTWALKPDALTMRRALAIALDLELPGHVVAALTAGLVSS